MKWFVYSNTTYYPGAVVVEAETAEEAKLMHYAHDHDGDGLAVFPLDALALWEGDRPIEEELNPE